MPVDLSTYSDEQLKQIAFGGQVTQGASRSVKDMSDDELMEIAFSRRTGAVPDLSGIPEQYRTAPVEVTPAGEPNVIGQMARFYSHDLPAKIDETFGVPQAGFDEGEPQTQNQQNFENMPLWQKIAGQVDRTVLRGAAGALGFVPSVLDQFGLGGEAAQPGGSAPKSKLEVAKDLVTSTAGMFTDAAHQAAYTLARAIGKTPEEALRWGTSDEGLIEARREAVRRGFDNPESPIFAVLMGKGAVEGVTPKTPLSIAEEVANATKSAGRVQDQVGERQVAADGLPDNAGGIQENRANEALQTQGQVGSEIPDLTKPDAREIRLTAEIEAQKKVLDAYPNDAPEYPLVEARIGNAIADLESRRSAFERQRLLALDQIQAGAENPAQLQPRTATDAEPIPVVSETPSGAEAKPGEANKAVSEALQPKPVFRIFIGKMDSISDAVSTDGGSIHIMTQSAKEPGKLQLTEYINEDGILKPIGDTQYKSIGDIQREMKDRNYRPLSGTERQNFEGKATFGQLDKPAPLQPPSQIEAGKIKAKIGEAKPKEPWEMTRAEFDATHTGWRGASHSDIQDADGTVIGKVPNPDKSTGEYATDKFHRYQVTEALEQGKPVPASVLADYPDLAKKYTKPEGKTGYTVNDVTPKGYGPTELSDAEIIKGMKEQSAIQARTTEQDQMRASIAEGKTILKGEMSPEKRAAIEAQVAKTEAKYKASLSPEQLADEYRPAQFTDIEIPKTKPQKPKSVPKTQGPQPVTASAELAPATQEAAPIIPEEAPKPPVDGATATGEAKSVDAFGGGVSERHAGLTPDAVAKSLEEINKSGAVEDVRKMVIPASRGENASKMAGLIREGAARLALSDLRAQRALSGARKFFSSVPKEHGYDFIDRVEHGQAQTSPDLNGMAKAWRDISDADRRAVQGLGTGKLQSFYENYFPHMWKDPKKASEVIAQMLGRRPMEGSKAFLKKRSIEFFSDGIAAGLEPVSENPVDLMLLKHHEIQKYVMAHTVLKQARELGLTTFVNSFEKGPDGMKIVDDRISTVFGPSSIPMKEYVDRSVYDGLSKVAADLGIEHERKMRVGHRSLGLSYGGENRIETQYASETSVLAHEIGHQLDYKYNLWDNLLKRNSGKGFQSGRSELRAIADLTGRGKKARTRAEKIAQVLEAYVHAPEDMERVAPRVYSWFDKFLASHKELSGLRDIRPGLKLTELTNEQPVGGMVITGHWYMPEEAARLVNNYLSPGLAGRSAIFRGYRGLSNWLNQFQLGFSAFHLGFTSFDAATSSFALGLYKTSHGDVLAGMKDMAKTPIAPVTTIIQGRRLFRAALAEHGLDPAMQSIVESLTAGGGRLKMEDFYHTTMTRAMTDAFNKHNYVGAVVRLPFAATELAIKPVLEYIVPSQKLGVFANMMRYELERSPNMDVVEQRKVAGRAWDSVDNRLGQLVYDNLFWDKTFKDLSMASVRSLGWNLGTIRELGGGLADFTKAAYKVSRGEKAEVTHRMTYVVALPIVAGLCGAITQYLFTGKGPEELKDYFYPKTGGVDAKGLPERVVLPTYMKDVYHYYHQPGQTLVNKLHPMLSVMADMLRNEDFYGTKIRNSDDPVMRQILDVAEYGGKALTPFAVRGLQQNLKEGEGALKAALPFIGITPAPRNVKMSPAEKKLSEIMAESGHRGSQTKEEAEHSQLKRDLRSDFRRSPGHVPESYVKATTAGQLSRGEQNALKRSAKETYLQSGFRGLPLEDAIKVWDAAEDTERRALRLLMYGKIDRFMKSASREEKAQLQGKIDKVKVDMKGNGR